jgi:hypothetical protein
VNDDLAYLNDVLERLQRIDTYTQQGRELFLQSSLIQDAVIRNFEANFRLLKAHAHSERGLWGEGIRVLSIKQFLLLTIAKLSCCV